MSFYKYAVLLSYVGTRYCGWQTQLTEKSGPKPSIQEVFEKTLHSIVSESPSAVSSGRTDAGVHALGQVIHFRLHEKEWDVGILQRALNSRLPTSIRVREVQRVPPEFHAQRSAQKKQYSYYFQQGGSALPHLEPYSYWIRKTLNIDAMNQALRMLQGEHDVKAFGARGSKPGKSTVRKIFEAEATWSPVPFPIGVEDPGGAWGLIRLRIVGSGFLKQMVRGIAGTLLQIGEGRRDPDCIREILQSGDRSQVGPTAPARALWLEKVWYPGLEWH